MRTRLKFASALAIISAVLDAGKDVPDFLRRLTSSGSTRQDNLKRSRHDQKQIECVAS
jgi:hypothetical protein